MTSVVAAKRAPISKPAPKRAFVSESSTAAATVTPVSALAGLAIIGRTGPLPATIAPTSSRRSAAADSIFAPMYSPIAASTITPKPKPTVTPRKPTVTTSVSKPIIKKKVSTPTAPVTKKAEETKTKKVEKRDDKVTSTLNPAVPSEKKSAPASVISPAPVKTVSATTQSTQSVSGFLPPPLSNRDAPFPEYSAKFARDNAHVIQTANNLTTPYDTDDNIYRSSFKDEQQQQQQKLLSKLREKKFELDKFGRLTIPLIDLMEAVEWVHAKGKTSLILDPSKRVDAFYSYNSTQLIEGKKLFLAKMHGAATLDAQLEALRKQVNIAWRYGHTLLLSLADSAVDFLTQYNAPTFFPTPKLFDAAAFLPVRTPKPVNASEDWQEPEPVITTPAFCNELTRQADKEKGGVWFNLKEPLIHKDYRLVVTSEFELEDYQEFLKESIPLQQCIVVQIIQPEGSEYQSPMKQLKHLLL